MKRRVILWVPIAISLALVAKGVGQLLFVPKTGYDIRLLWTATQYFLRGANPFAASFYANDLARGLHPSVAPTYFPDLGWPEQVNYPPTSTLTQILLFSLPLPATYVIYILMSLAGVCLVGWWASRAVDGPPLLRWSFAGLALANLGYSQTIINGNYGIFAIAALIAAIVLRSRAPLIAGVLLGMALVKPTLTAPFLLLFLADGCLIVLAVCALYLVTSTVVTVMLTGVSVMALVHASIEGSSRFATGGYGLWQTLRTLGLSQSIALALNAAIFVVPLIVIVWRVSRRDGAFTLPLLAATGIVARLFSYHNSIDNVIVTFLAVALAHRWVTARRPLDAVWLTLVLLSVLTPFVLTNSVWGHLALYALWSAATASLFVRREASFDRLSMLEPLRL